MTNNLHMTKPPRTFGWRTFGQGAVLLSTFWMSGWAYAQLAIQSVTAATQGGSDVIRIETSEPLGKLPAGFAIQNPARIALDLSGVTNGLGRNLVEFNQGNLRSVNVVEAGERTRVVLNLNQAAQYQTRIEGKALLVVLETTTSAPAPVAATFAQSGNQDVLPLSDIDFRRGTENTGRIIVNLANNQVGVDIRPQGKNLVVEFLKTSLPEGLRRRLDVTDFGTPVQTITTTQSGDRVRMVVEPKGLWSHSAYQSDNQFVLEVREQKVDPGKLTQGPGYAGEKLSLNFQNIEVRSLLQVIADFTNFNIVTSDAVSGNVTLRLKDVPWDQALDIILQAKGLGMRKTGNVIWIAPKDEIAAREKMDHEATATVQSLEPLRTQSFQINYAKAVDIAAQLRGETPAGAAGRQAAAAPAAVGAAAGQTPGARILSPRGSVIPELRTNQLFVTDIPSRLEQVRELIAKLDVPVRQVMIEARIVEADERFGKSLGVRFGFGARQVGIGSLNGNQVQGNLASTFNQVGLGPSMSDITPFVNFPAASLLSSSPASFAASLFNPSVSRLLALEISALQADNKLRIVSSPRLITADQNKSMIEQGVEIPYQKATSSGATSVEFRKASLMLEVTPQITPEGGIILDVEVSKDSPGEVLAGLVTINTNRVKTQVLVENGGTVVIGGIFRSQEETGESKVPLLGDIPVVGNLFKNKKHATEKKELLIFLTPRMLTNTLGSGQ